MISVKNISVSYQEKTVLQNVSIEIEQGKITGLVGPNGSGKSTLIKSILNLIDLDKGEIAIDGDSIKDFDKKRLAYIPQKDDVNWEFPATVEDVVMMGRFPHKKIFQTLNSTDKQLVNEALKDTEMLEFKHRQIGELSGGQQQRVFIARALCQEANFYFLDEPFVGVDMVTEDKIMNLLKTLRSKGKTIVIIHHDLSKVKDYFDNIILLNKKIIAHGKVETTFTKENINKAYNNQLPFL